MNCEDLNEALVDLVDGRLEGAGQRAVERHLEGCQNCRALVEDLRSIRAAAFMLDRREPKAETWSKAAGRRRCGACAARAPARDAARPRSAGASTGPCGWAPQQRSILATVIGLMPLMNRPESAHDDTAQDAAGDPAAEVTVESVTAEFEAAEKHYQKAIDDLQTIANKDTGELDPQVAAVLQKNLTVIDQAITESRDALRSQPSSANAQNGLFDALRSKVALLQQTVELINEMRKGNQAEAGRRVQTLSQ